MKIQELFDTGKRIDRNIESVVTFADNKAEDLQAEINEYVVTDKLRESYHKVIDLMQNGFSDTANEVGIWVSGFYGSGKSSFAKYLGYSFDTSLIVDGMSFGEKLMNRISDSGITAMHNSIIKRFNPIVVMIDLTTQAQVGKTSNVSDIIYYETLKELGIAVSHDPKIIAFNVLLKEQGKYDEFVALVKEKKGRDWATVQKNDLLANITASEFAPVIFPEYFSSKDDFKSYKIDSVENETERIQHLINVIKKETGHDKVLFVVDEVGNYISSNDSLITRLQGFMQAIKSSFRGDVWVIATAQQTLTEDNPNAQLNSPKLFTLNDRFPIKVDIEAEDIKEIITKRLLGKSTAGTDRLKGLFSQNEGSVKMNTKLNITNARSRYIQPIDPKKFADLYPFLPVHVDILLALLQKLASRTGGVGLRSVIRLIRDILVDNHLADENVGKLANPSHFYDVLRSDMSKSSDYKEIVTAADQAVSLFRDDALAVAICKTIAVMQILDDFPLTFENICALLYQEVGKDTNKSAIRDILNEIKGTAGVTLEEVDGKFRFMTNAILSVKEERNHMTVQDQKRDEVMRELVKDLLTPAPQVQIFGSKTIKPSVDLTIGRRSQGLLPGDNLKIVFTFVDPSDFETVERRLRGDSTDHSNERTMYMVSTLQSPIEGLLNEIVRDMAIVSAHANDNNKEVRDYLKSQEEDAKNKKQEVRRLLGSALGNSESIWQGQTEAVDGTTYVSKSLRKFAEKAFEKYSYAPKSLSTNAVRDISKYDNWASLPESLNPFGLVKSDGSIDSNADSLRDLYDYISSKDPDGNKLLSYFEGAPYGWAKDTTRYLVALLLKDNKIVVRSGAQSFKMLTDKAAEAMKNNASFAHISFSRNTEKQLNAMECLKAKQNLVKLFNSPNVALTIDSIAKNAFKAMTSGFKDKADRLAQDYHEVHLAGADIVNKAINYAARIISSEGADAPALFAQDQDCFDSMKYVIDVEKSAVISVVKTIRRRLRDIDSLTTLPQLKDFFEEVSNLKEVYNTLLQDSDCISHKSEYSDIDSKLRAAIKMACADFCQTQNEEIQKSITKIVAGYDTTKLTPEQQQSIEYHINRVQLKEGDGTFEDLKTIINDYNLAFNPVGPIYQIGDKIQQYIIANEPEPTPDPEPNPVQPVEPAPDPKPYPKPREPKTTPVSTSKVMKKSDVQSFIQNLQGIISDMDDLDSVEINIL